MKPGVPPKRSWGLSPLERQNLRNGLLFTSPWLIGFSVFLAYPILQSLYYSFCDFSVLQPPRWVGLDNYRQLFQDDVFLKALVNTVQYAAAAIPLSVLVAFALAMLLNTGVRGLAFYRTVFFLPSLIPSVALAILWLWIFNGQHGVLNYFLGSISRPLGWLLLGAALISPLLLGRLFSLGSTTGSGHGSPAVGWAVGAAAGCALLALLWSRGMLGFVPGQGFTGTLADLRLTPPNWLSEAVWVKPAFIFMSVWTCGHAMVIYLAGLQDVPVHLYEAADLDGANWWQKTRAVTLPMMSPVLLFNGIMAIIGTFNFFAVPFVMAPQGQPAREAYFLAVNLYDNCFSYLRMGYAAAMAWVLFLIILALTLLALKLSARHVHYGGG